MAIEGVAAHCLGDGGGVEVVDEQLHVLLQLARLVQVVGEALDLLQVRAGCANTTLVVLAYLLGSCGLYCTASRVVVPACW